MADDAGIVNATPATVRSHVFPDDADVGNKRITGWIDQLIEINALLPFKYNNENFYLIRTFKDHQVINRPTPSKVPVETLQLLFSEDSMSPPGALTVGRERKGIGKEGSGGTDAHGGDETDEKNKKVSAKPTEAEMIKYFVDNGQMAERGKQAFKYYTTPHPATGQIWVDSQGTPVRNWKQKVQVNWFKDKYKINQAGNTADVTAGNPYWNYVPAHWDPDVMSRIKSENYADRKVAAYELKLKRNGYTQQGDQWIKQQQPATPQ